MAPLDRASPRSDVRSDVGSSDVLSSQGRRLLSAEALRALRWPLTPADDASETLGTH